MRLDIPSLNIKYIDKYDDETMDKLRFPEEFLAPEGCFDKLYYESKRRKEEDKSVEAFIIDDGKLHNELLNLTLTLYRYEANPSEIIPGFGAKFISNDVVFSGFGLYKIINETGFKKRRSKDWRYFEADSSLGIDKEEIYLWFHNEKEKYVRIDKKKYQEKINEIKKYKNSNEVKNIIRNYMNYHDSLMNLNILKCEDRIEKVSECLPFIKKYLDLQRSLGHLNEMSFKKIKEQITELEGHLENQNDEGVKKSILKMTRNVFWICMIDGEFYENLKTFHNSYTLTDVFNDQITDEKRKKATYYYLVFNEYINLRKQNTEAGKFNQTGWYYEPLIQIDDVKEIDKMINEYREKIKKKIGDFTNFPELQNVYLDFVKK